MLSNPTNALHSRQRQHRRQQSTPTAFDSLKVSNLPSIQRNHGHRRGMSLDQRRRQTPPQDRLVCSINPGFTTPQHLLRETQQQRLVRPGVSNVQFGDDHNYLNSPVITPHRNPTDPNFLHQYGETLHEAAYFGSIHPQIDFAPNEFHSNTDFYPYTQDSSLAPASSFLELSSSFGNSINNLDNETYSRRNSVSRRISDGILHQVSQFENLALQSPQRPLTPSNHNIPGWYCFYSDLSRTLTETGYYPPTPTDTPRTHMMKQSYMNARFMDGYDTSMEETIKPSVSQRSRGIFDDMRNEIEMKQNTNQLQSGLVLEKSSLQSIPAPIPAQNLVSLNSLNSDLKIDEQFCNGSNISSNSTNISPILTGYPSSPEKSLNSYATVRKTDSSTKPRIGPPAQPSSQSIQSRRKSAHRKSQSSSTLNIEEAITETGVTIDDIASFISGPDPLDGGKWLCMYPECNKRFGRKENIKSHVQTHLGDRQFQCPYCQKCFVRQHDLKRHAKIHSGGLEGVVKKVAKRGRPRKYRPNDEERLEKSARTQRKNHLISGASSTSGCSESGDAPSPRSDLDEIPDNKTYADYEYYQAPLSIQTSSFNYQPTRPSEACSYGSSAVLEASTSKRPVSMQGSYPEISLEIPHVLNPLPRSKHLPNTHNFPSSPMMCESKPSPRSSHKYFAMELGPSSDGDFPLSASEMSALSGSGDDLFFEAFTGSEENTRIHDLHCEQDLSIGKRNSLFSHATNDFFPISSNVYFGTS
ncbi:C2H2 type zinc finger containing protein [Blumeria hordei DH14]|uniref:C2H2 type zinc finger containing protein n=1 Tax=Blumeria graminis f. sp. hordei (strain DH14) TaxID=546991 RepID=N1J8N1_BLUG1|nr:C2H2 type zinc finger containing protein [Blumeria hordei DH14]